MQTKQIDARFKTAIKAAQAAGKVLLDNFKKPIKVKAKGDRDLVSDIDIKAEEAIIKLIKKSHPGDNILSEESSHLHSNKEIRWIIDPLDGTHNYIRKTSIFGTSIAVEIEGTVVAGVIYMPLEDEMYFAKINHGAYKNKKRIYVSKKQLRESTLVFDSSIRYEKDNMLKCLGNLVDEVFNIRMFGSSARHLSYIAEGKVDIDVEFYDKVWDFAAGLLLIEEAQGKCTDFEGNKWSTDTKHYIASNGVSHNKIIELMKYGR